MNFSDEERHNVPCLLDRSDFENLDLLYESIFPRPRDGEFLNTPPPILEAEELRPSIGSLVVNRPVISSSNLAGVDQLPPISSAPGMAQPPNHQLMTVESPVAPIRSPIASSSIQIESPISSSIFLAPNVLRTLLQLSAHQIHLQLGSSSRAATQMGTTDRESDAGSPVDESSFRAEWFMLVGVTDHHQHHQQGVDACDIEPIANWNWQPISFTAYSSGKE